MSTSEAILALETRGPKPTLISQELWIILNSPANVYVTDPDGKHIGTNPLTGEVVNEIEGATYTGPGTEPQEIKIPYPLKGRYDVQLVGTGTGTYTLTIKGVSSGMEVSSETIQGDITQGEIQETDLVLTSIVGELDLYVEEVALLGDMDKDGDVDYDDYALFRTAYGSCEGDANFNPDADLDADRCVTINDLRVLRTLVTR